MLTKTREGVKGKVLHVLSLTVYRSLHFQISILRRDLQKRSNVVLSRKQKPCIIELYQKLCACMMFPMWPPLVFPSWGLLLIVEPYPAPTPALTARHPHQETASSPSWPGHLFCVTPPSRLNVEQCPAEHLSWRVNTYAICAHAHASTQTHKHQHTHTQANPLPTSAPIVRLSSSCFSTHPHCCHSGQEAVGEIRMTKSLFIKLARVSVVLLESPFVCMCVCLSVCLREREEKKRASTEEMGVGT